MLNHEEHVMSTVILDSNFCHYCDGYMHVKATITAPNTAAAAELVNNPNKKVIFKN